jgi:hypothetical protein
MRDADIARCTCGSWLLRGTDCRTCQILEHDATLAAWRASLPRVTAAQVRAAEREAWGEAVRAEAKRLVAA